MYNDNTPRLVLRARRLQGLTQEQFGQRLGVEASTVSRWERGKMRPSADIWSQVIKIVADVRIDTFVRASNLFKYIAPIGNLLMPILMSHGAAAFYESEYCELARSVRSDPHYPISGVRALEIIGSDPQWQTGDVTHASAHCLAVNLNRTWVDLMVTALPEKQQAIIEYAPSMRSDDNKFSVKITYLTGFVLKA